LGYQIFYEQLVFTKFFFQNIEGGTVNTYMKGKVTKIIKIIMNKERTENIWRGKGAEKL